MSYFGNNLVLIVQNVIKPRGMEAIRVVVGALLLFDWLGCVENRRLRCRWRPGRVIKHCEWSGSETRSASLKSHEERLSRKKAVSRTCERVEVEGRVWQARIGWNIRDPPLV